ncbi:MAG: hypothetical protein WAZ98_09680 [Cyclobacteriaceae bacterium]
MRPWFFLSLALFLFCSEGVNAQDFKQDQVIAEAKTQLIALSAEEGELNKYCREKNIQGEFVMDITLQGKGRVLTVYMVSGSTEDLSYQNLLKSRLAEIQFENIKIPKNQRVKFRHTLTF